MMEGYCMKCKKKVEIVKPTKTTTKKGTAMSKGSCPVCGTTVCRIGG